MIKTYKILSILLNYPSEETLEILDEVAHELEAEKLLDQKNIAEIGELVAYLKNNSLFSLQEDYVGLFDRNRSLSLHLFEHVHGESRDRGQAMVDLLALYEEKDFEIDAKELPDFLPLFLEFLATNDSQSAAELLGEPIDIIAVIGARLRIGARHQDGARHQKSSPYAAIFSALEFLSAKKPRKVFLEKIVSKEVSNDELDKEWEERRVDFLAAADPAATSPNSCSTAPAQKKSGCGSGGCGGCS